MGCQKWLHLCPPTFLLIFEGLGWKFLNFNDKFPIMLHYFSAVNFVNFYVFTKLNKVGWNYGELKRHFHSVPCFHKSAKKKLYSDALWWLFRYVYLLNVLIFCTINTDQDHVCVQVNLCQKLLFLLQLTYNMTTDCSLNYQFSKWKFQAQNMLCI